MEFEAERLGVGLSLAVLEIGHHADQLGEEALETAIAAVQDDPDALAAESADLIYHWLVVLAAAEVSAAAPRSRGLPSPP